MSSTAFAQAFRVHAAWLAAGLLMLLTCMARPVTAATVYKCSGHGGQVVYQDAPCAKSQQQQTLNLHDEAPGPSPAAAPLVPQQASAPPAPPPAPAAIPTAPLPPMYTCIRATDGKHYVSGNGDPQPYLAPFGMLGAVQRPLAEVYGGPGAAGVSAPELNHGRVTSGLVANHYVWVQDQCRELSRRETCEALRDAYEHNEQQLQRAFKSDQPPLEQREKELRAQLSQC
ncbi:DUF4124 domain-containing protein [Dyella silvatica]|uniref:DUF4124 domain-containing protein n=1 Tax=Dyella silvatica TaxID=2992128 RepID=UPI00224C9E6C|nr:DUF4124 domain-containing protein [Dyella silvatica]